MPYKIKKFDDGFRVESDKNHYLSKKPLTKKQAHKQLVAVSLNEGLFGSGIQPPEKDFYLASKQSYNITNTAEKNIDGLNLVLETPTVKAYLNENEKTMLLAIRGTKPQIAEDLRADGMIALNMLSSTDRYKKDREIVNSLLFKYPASTYDYYLTGHSLAGAIIAQLKRDFPQLKNAVVYNPASQPYDYISQQSNEIKRIYTENDPLYNLGSKVFWNKQVIPTSRKLAPDIPNLGALNYGSQAYNYYQGHALDNFKGLYGLGRGGAWYDIFKPKKIINEFINPDSLLRSTVGKVENEIFNNDSISRRRISDVFKGIRNNLPPSVRRFLEQYGDELIQNIMIRRDPIQSALNTAFELITLGQWSKAKSKEKYDDLFHLGLVLTLSSGKQILIEKNEVINIGDLKPLEKDSQTLNLSQLIPPISLNQFIANGVAMKGDDFYRYDPFENNCQDFVAILLRANNKYSPEAKNFVKQPVESLLKQLPEWTQSIAKGITDLGAIANVALEGAGKKQNRESFRKMKLNDEIAFVFGKHN